MLQNNYQFIDVIVLSGEFNVTSPVNSDYINPLNDSERDYLDIK